MGHRLASLDEELWVHGAGVTATIRGAVSMSSRRIISYLRGEPWILLTIGLGVLSLLVLLAALLVTPKKGIVDGTTEDIVSVGATRVVLFLDVATVEGRQVFSEVARYVRAEGAELVVIHAPRGGCGDESLESYSCIGARVIECVSRLSPEDTSRVVGLAVDLQWEPTSIGVGTLIERATSDKVAREGLARCTESDSIVAAVGAQASLAARLGFTALDVEGGMEGPKAGGFLLWRGERGLERGVFGENVTEEVLRQMHRCMEDEECGGQL